MNLLLQQNLSQHDFPAVPFEEIAPGGGRAGLIIDDKEKANEMCSNWYKKDKR